MCWHHQYSGVKFTFSLLLYRYCSNSRYKLVKPVVMKSSQTIMAMSCNNNFHSCILNLLYSNRSTITLTSASWFSFLIDMCMLVDLLFTAGSNKTVQIHDMNTMQQVRTLYGPHNRTVNCIALNKVCSVHLHSGENVCLVCDRVHLIQDYLVKLMTFFWPHQWLVEWNCGI